LYTYAAAPIAAGNGACGGWLHTIVDYNDYGTISASSSGLASIRDRETYRSFNITVRLP